MISFWIHSAWILQVMLPWIDYSLDNSTLYPRIIMIQPSPKSSRKPGLAEQTWNKRSGRCQWVGWYCCFCLPGLLVPTFCSWTDMFLTQLGMTLFFSMTVDHLTQDCPGVSFFFCPVFYYEHQFLILFLTGVYSSLEFPASCCSESWYFIWDFYI